jgi:hypothetical protein
VSLDALAITMMLTCLVTLIAHDIVCRRPGVEVYGLPSTRDRLQRIHDALAILSALTMPLFAFGWGLRQVLHVVYGRWPLLAIEVGCALVVLALWNGPRIRRGLKRLREKVVRVGSRLKVVPVGPTPAGAR